MRRNVFKLCETVVFITMKKFEGIWNVDVIFMIVLKMVIYYCCVDTWTHGCTTTDLSFWCNTLKWSSFTVFIWQ